VLSIQQVLSPAVFYVPVTQTVILNYFTYKQLVKLPAFPKKSPHKICHKKKGLLTKSTE